MSVIIKKRWDNCERQVLRDVCMLLPLEYWICAIPFSTKTLFTFLYEEEDQLDDFDQIGMDERDQGLAWLNPVKMISSVPYLQLSRWWLDKCHKEAIVMNWSTIVSVAKRNRKEAYIQSVLRDWNQFYFENSFTMQQYWLQKSALQDQNINVEVDAVDMVEKIYRARRCVYMELMTQSDHPSLQSEVFREQARLFAFGPSHDITIPETLAATHTFSATMVSANDMAEPDS